MRHAFRTLHAKPALSMTVAGTLALALTFMIASVSILDGLLVRPYPYPKLQQLLLVRDAKPRDGVHQRRSVAVADFLDARESASAFESLAAWRPAPLVITNAGAEPERVESIAATANFFATLGVTPLYGRTFPLDADTAGKDGVVLLSRRLWNSRFGAAPSLVGHAIGLNGRSVEVIGIIGDEDCYPPGVDAWVPLVFTPSEAADRAVQSIAAFGRLPDTSTEAEAAAQLASLSGMLAARYPLTNRGRGFELLRLQREQYEFTAPLFLFVLAAALLVLALAVINVSNLLVARTLDRRRELAVRAMLGASARGVVSVGIAEVGLLATVATAFSLFAATGMLNAIRASIPEGIARWVAGWTSLRVDAIAAASGVGVGVLAAGVISLVVGIASLRAARETGGSPRVTRSASWGRRFLVAGEVSLATALLLGASVMVAGFTRISAAFESLAPSRLLQFTLTLPESRYPDAIRIAAFHGAVLDRIHAVPGVERAALIRNAPASNVPNPVVAFQRDDAPAQQPSERPRVDVEVVSPAVFEALRLRVVSGRALADGDGADAARVAVVSQAAARRFWPDRDPVGAVVRFDPDARPVRIVGVVSDFILNWYDPEMRPVMFLPDAQSPARTTTVVVRTRLDPMSLARPIRLGVAQLDDRQPLTEVESLSTTISDSLAPIRVIERLLLVGAGLATALAAIGVYSVLAHWVGARRRELGVRFALGATRAAIARFVLREACPTACAGIVAGLGLAGALVQLAGSALLGVPSLDLYTIGVVTAAAIALILAGSLGPARRAAAVDVADLLRLD
jgi:predicted permease